MNTRLVEFKETFKAKGREFQKGERIVVDETTAWRYVRDMGIAIDVETGEDNPRTPGAAKQVQPESVRIEQSG